MSARNKWRARLAVVLGTVALSVVVPVAAWAGSGTATAMGSKEAKGGFSGFECCLVAVVAAVALTVKLVRDHRNRPPE
ncbi:hypothetical protein [Micromonospora chalcea]|uniref:hypothetical protein n=1 Tax=Micromonospora chalcea TaxID=1874 RepID=UPI0021A7DA06|nr:hypothetical protein [Micromonospora chalcea]MCT2279529.1 hypothetical protein [Micromonospora chalcea]